MGSATGRPPAGIREQKRLNLLKLPKPPSGNSPTAAWNFMHSRVEMSVSERKAEVYHADERHRHEKITNVKSSIYDNYFR